MAKYLVTRLILLFLAAIAIVLLFHDGEIDKKITTIFFDTYTQTFPLRTHDLVDRIIYRGSKIAMGGVFLVFVTWGLWALRSKRPGFNARHLWTGIAGTALTIGVVSILKTATGIECPWSTLPFGGQHELLSLEDSFNKLLSGSRGSGRCFPAGHPTGGLFLLSWAVAIHKTAPTAGKVTASVGIGIGILMGLTRIAQGAHFLSHIVWTIWLSVLIALLLHVFFMTPHNPTER